MEYVSEDNVKTKGMQPVGFYVTPKVYKEYLQMATELHNQKAPDQNGHLSPILEKADVNLFLSFCVQFYKQYSSVMSNITSNPQASAMIENLAEQLAKAGGFPQ